MIGMMVATRQTAQQALSGAKTALPPPATPLRKSSARARRGQPPSPAASPVAAPAQKKLFSSSAASVEPNHGDLVLETLDARQSLTQGMRQLEQQLASEGCSFIVGVDEAGRGPLVRAPRRACAALACQCQLLPAPAR